MLQRRNIGEDIHNLFKQKTVNLIRMVLLSNHKIFNVLKRTVETVLLSTHKYVLVEK